jgi:hypothetical protein
MATKSSEQTHLKPGQFHMLRHSLYRTWLPEVGTQLYVLNRVLDQELFRMDPDPQLWNAALDFGYLEFQIIRKYRQSWTWIRSRRK